ncbi:hypothetical protein RRG08_012188 [Elysia crispata]|uniref:Uncharacterized protein n=1 Tax=Elysia crispata TaxID=231223 RepID=A0AAE1DH79_9GAST|nr:hypothetical protein RRG08_012188 [Elysia crispata]
MTAGQSSQQTQSGMYGEPIAERTSHPKHSMWRTFYKTSSTFSAATQQPGPCSLRPSVVFGCKGILIIFGIFQAYETQRVRLKQVNDSSDNLTEIFNLFFILRRSPATD